MILIPEFGAESSEHYDNFFQDEISVVLHEVGSDQPADIDIVIIGDEKRSDIDIQSQLREKIKGRYWWLNDYWRAKGNPVEQIRCTAGTKVIDIFNFLRPLSSDELSSIQRALELVGNISDGELLKDLDFILINDEQPENPKSGEPTYAENFISSSRSIRIDPRTLSERDIARIPGARALEAIIIHECGHSISVGVQNKWNRGMGWKLDLDHTVPLRSGSETIWRNDYLETMVNDYARQDGKEDFCESFAAALLTPEILDPKRFFFIQENFLSSLKAQEERVRVAVTRLAAATIEPPRVEAVSFRRRASSLFSIRKIE